MSQAPPLGVAMGGHAIGTHHRRSGGGSHGRPPPVALSARLQGEPPTLAFSAEGSGAGGCLAGDLQFFDAADLFDPFGR